MYEINLESSERDMSERDEQPILAEEEECVEVGAIGEKASYFLHSFGCLQIADND